MGKKTPNARHTDAATPLTTDDSNCSSVSAAASGSEAKAKPKSPRSKQSKSRSQRNARAARNVTISSLTSDSDSDQAVANSSANDEEEEEQPAVCKIRIVPLEKLLASPKTKERSPRKSVQKKITLVESSSDSEALLIRIKSPLPARKRSAAIIELSDSEEEDDLEPVLLANPLRRRREEDNQQKKSQEATNKRPEQASTSSGATKNGNRPHRGSLSSERSSKASSSRAESPVRPKRCVVRLKRVSLPKPKPAQKTKKMSTDSEEAATTSKKSRQRRSKSESEADSDYEAPAAEEQEEDRKSSEDEEEEAANSSDSEVIPQRKRRRKKSDSEKGSSDFEPDEKQKKKGGRKRIKKNSSGESDDDEDKQKNKRKHIRKIIKTKDLDLTTKEAAKEEDDRRKRIEDRQKLYNRIFVKSESVEINELVLDFDADSKKALLQVDKGLLKKLKPHQVAGVKFMWDACFETLQESREKPGSGCILAHCMGLGKTLQVVTLSHTLLVNTRRTGVDRVLVISPLSTVNNWAREFNNWMKFANRNDIEVYDISRYKDKPTRIFKLNEWFKEGGVCILGYDMYRILANEKAKGLRKKQREQLMEALVDPGPDLVVCDEGHLLKNEKTSISKAVTRMRTKRRIVLTGTPLQNNLREYYCMIQFVKPNLLGTYKEYMNRFVNPITNGQYTDSTDRDLRLMKHRSHILHKLLEGCIQRRDYSVLAPYLPPKHEYVVYTTLSELQQKLYGYYMTTHREQSGSDVVGKGARLFQDFQDLRRIWTHPMNLRVNSDNVIAKRLLSNDDSDIDGFICDETDEEEAASNSSDSCESFKSDASTSGLAASSGKVKKRKTRNGNAGGADSDSDLELLSGLPSGASVQKDDPSEWWKPFVEERELNNVHHSPKLLILLRLLQQCEAIGDKLLVFSQSLQSLDVIEHFLSLVDSNTKNYEFEGDVGDFKGCWTNGKDYFRLDGSCSVEQREAMCKQFNNVTNLRARLFLISTRAGGLGINLVAANRVVIFDVSWNPSHDTQSIFRVYRFGQIKPCYIYRLIAMGTMEQKVYERQVAKQATAKRVIDEQQISRHYNQTDLMELYSYELQPSTEREMPILPKDRLFAEILTEHDKLIFKYHEHDSLLEQEEHENLSEEERKSAWAEYEAEKTRTVQASQYMSYDRNAFGNQVMGQFGNASGSVTSNKIFGFRSDILLQLLNMKISKDHPELNQNQVIQLVPTYLQQLYNEMNNGDPTMYKDLLSLHSNIVHPSGMYMNPLLYANQHPNAAGYNQGTGGPPGPAGSMPPAPHVTPAPGFEPDKVYEID
ncbi:transcriptional regulator ATRX homolog [Drosophila biarmipes]|uniref:transcriptional regulator ATRX homolog n=1 Tax=Drosophila biarmipes TaxID=125945 RepID=UPI0007E8660F|nr:transcriptional regulator ATRX homolog [Drosophila biarmipes]XP_016952622.1 transcriptional regulator ATRX homolog [Drosophila biarmipes]